MLDNLFGGSSGSVSTSSNSSPWAPQQPFLTDVFKQAQGLYNRGPYGGPFVGTASPFSSMWQNMAAQRATDPNSLTSQAQRGLGATISGQYLNPDSNPYLRSSVQDALGLAGSAFASQYGGAAGKNLENSGYQEALARGLGATATNAYANAYGTERQNQLAAMQAAPGLDYANLAPLQAAAQSQEARSQKEADAMQQGYMSPWSNLANYRNAISGAYGGTQSGTQPYFTNPLGNALGLGIGGATLYGLGKDSGLWGALGSGVKNAYNWITG